MHPISYTKGILEIGKIIKKTRIIPDFINIDLIDETYNSENISIDIEILHKIRELWPQKKLQIHIMSKNPNFWINQLPKSRNSQFPNSRTP